MKGFINSISLKFMYWFEFHIHRSVEFCSYTVNSNFLWEALVFINNNVNFVLNSTVNERCFVKHIMPTMFVFESFLSHE